MPEKNSHAHAAVEVTGNVDILTPHHLQMPKGAERGDDILTDERKGVLIRLPDLEGKEWLVPLAYIDPNPRQPRKYFDPEKMGGLKEDIQREGQMTAIEAVPCLTSEGEIRLFLMDGERRYRAMKELGSSHVRTLVRWEPSVRKIFKKALKINLQREGHNPIEIAEGYKQLIDDEMEEKFRSFDKAVIAVSKEMGVKTEMIRKYLRLLNLPEPIKAMIIKDKLPIGASLYLGDAASRHGDSLNMLRVARILMDSLDRQEDPFGTIKDVHKVTVEDVKAATRRAILEGAGAEDMLALEVAAAIVRLPGTLAPLQSIVGKLTRRDPELVDSSLRNRGRGKPPEVLRDQVRDAIEALEKVLPVLERAVEPPSLRIPPGKPRFSAFLGSKTTNAFAGELRQRIAMELAKASDDKGKIMTVAELAEALGVDSVAVGNHMRYVQERLDAMGITLEEHVSRAKVARSGRSRETYDSTPAYRLAWKPEVKSPPSSQPSGPASPPDGKDTLVSSPPTPAQPAREKKIPRQ